MSEDVKAYKTYAEQVGILAGRGMDMGDEEIAVATLRRVNYYRLSGYWYPFRKLVSSGRENDFYPGTRFRDVVALYDFDARLRSATFAALMPVELAVRALLGHELGRIDPCVHLEVSRLGPTARQGNHYSKWIDRYRDVLANSREEFIAHHDQKYGGRLPVWAATEILDWGSLTYLYGFAPRHVQDVVAEACGLTAPQLTSWLKALNLLRNTCAHHGRLFNRVHTISPKLPRVGRHPDLDVVSTDWSRTFGQLTLIQFLSDRLGVGRTKLLPAVLNSFPTVQLVPVAHMGVPDDWQLTSTLWE
ncbi:MULTISPECIES: Abi family protein [unclassified Leifsonia]|uniref:Abi family protein n=1 Tax=unclassified Leifsonia TaxID=2663824 RepID=UPI0008A79C99|nr:MULTISPECIES: Abi family protein [unclassified Leifsonia]SEH91348.1 Abortive infection bacteriophage resistance protein [Leifsonia sp. CL154]SFL52532.1 Abortive infection bacteriophage resistance protein [Leifsonia sp. CL147]